jgi:hypothetical protein
LSRATLWAPGRAGEAARLAAGEGDGVEVALERALAAGDEVDEAGLFVDADEVVYRPCPLSQLAEEPAVAVVEVEVVKPVALGGPEEAARGVAFGRLERAKVAVEVDPDVGGLAEQLLRAAAAEVEADEAEDALLAILQLGEQVALGGPVDAGEVLGAFEVHPDGAAARARDDAEADAGVGLAGEGVGVVLLRRGADLIFALMDDPVGGDVGLVDLGVGEVGGVVAPPIALAAGHLFLGDVLGEAVGAAAAAGAAGELPGRAAGDGDDVELGVLDVGDPLAVAAEARVEGRGGAGCDELAELSAARGGVVDDVDPAGEGDEDPRLGGAVVGPGVAGDPEVAGARALAAELLLGGEVVLGLAAARRGEQELLLAGVGIEEVELLGEAAIRAAKVCDPTIVGAPADRRGGEGAGQRVLGDGLGGEGGAIVGGRLGGRRGRLFGDFWGHGLLGGRRRGRLRLRFAGEEEEGGERRGRAGPGVEGRHRLCLRRRHRGG